MEVLNKLLYSQSLQMKARGMSAVPQVPAPTSPIDMNGMSLLYPELNISSIALLQTNAWNNLLINQSAMVAWLQQQRAKAVTNPAQQQHVNSLMESITYQENLVNSRRINVNVPSTGALSPKSPRVSFSIDNIMNGKYEESRKCQQSPEQPSSPAHSSTSSSSTISEANIGGLKYECEVCSKTYSTFSGFSKHKQFYCTPQSKKQFNCKHCDKTYFSLGALKMHIRTHTLPCKCKICGKAFSRPWLLQGHMRTHTGEKPFKCQHCNRAFADRSNLRAHLQTHSDIKKYNCKQCDKTFSRMSLLVKHEESSCLSPGNIMSSMF